MEKLNAKLMAFDLDDTLLTSERTVSEKTVSVLKKCVEKESYILDEFDKEIKKFEAALGLGLKEFDKCVLGIIRKNELVADLRILHILMAVYLRK